MTAPHGFAPTIDDIDRIARAAMTGLPPVFQRHLPGIVLRIEDFPSKAVMQDMELESPFDILGLYHGHEVGRSVEVSGALPDTVYLYRRPLIDYWAEHEETLEHLVSHVLIHEIGHHFGLSDDDMHGLEDEVE
ncbi:metallopeptidase family protein [Pacificimonas sp. WHA3]|uniref:Metallopeptidase family protein n=1 Tax=Pacificimonas pallii TaxID=2827236 RepID=A0ABS6SB02_9SPHN|nr:metallopeptidase family protein [Pacificimonas pallii]MBV7255584.1 metallopeptidase family protein [Pacificimonas pallii]